MAGKYTLSKRNTFRLVRSSYSVQLHPYGAYSFPNPTTASLFEDSAPLIEPQERLYVSTEL